MAHQTPTILTLKQNFLTTQTRLLSQPLQPSRAWRRANESESESSAAADADADGEDKNRNRNRHRHGRLSEKAVDDALFRLNHALQQHARRVYAPQATRHVAEQIDKLYLSVGERGAGGGGGGGGGDGDGDDDAWRNVGADLANPDVIASLPPAWGPEREAVAYPLEAKRYAELVDRLRTLSARRQGAEARVRRLRRMRALLEPFRLVDQSTDADTSLASAGAGAGDETSFNASNGVQENLITRDCEVEQELERMRMLLARVGDKVARVKEREGEDEDDDSEDLFGEGDAMIVDDVEVDERRKVEGLLDGLG